MTTAFDREREAAYAQLLARTKQAILDADWVAVADVQAAMPRVVKDAIESLSRDQLAQAAAP